MSWLVSSIASSLKLDDDVDEFGAGTTKASTAAENSTPPEIRASQAQNPKNDGDQQTPNTPPDQTTPPRGVKEDLSEISKTLTRQLWGVASFLAPPPQISDCDRRSHDYTDPPVIAGIRNDLSEIGGKFRTGISKLSGNKTVSEFTKIASNLLQFGSEEELSVEDYRRRGVVGVTEEVVAFARDISLHPETWLDFPLPDDDDELVFDLSDAQQEHALAVERLAPGLAALRTELCLGYMSEASFWKIYFVLVHPRLSRHDADILSTPEIVRARAMLSHELHIRGRPQPFESRSDNALTATAEVSREEHHSVPVIDQSESVPVEISVVEPASTIEADFEMEKLPVIITEIPVIDKTVEEFPMKDTNIEPSTLQSHEHRDEDDVDDWLKEENTEGSSVKGTSYPVGNDDDISFSDLEEDEDVTTKSHLPEHPIDRVSGDTLESKESNGWLDIEDIDVA